MKNKTTTKELYEIYWTKVKEEIDKNYPKFNSRKPYAQNYYNLAIGSSLAVISMDINTEISEIKAQIYIPNKKSLFDYLHDSKDKIESELGFEMN